MKRIFKYLVVTFIFSWVFMLLKYLAQEQIIPIFFNIIGSLFLLGPLVGYLYILKLDNKNIWKEIKGLFKHSSPKWIYWFVVISPFVLSFLAYLIMIIINGEQFKLGMSFQMIVPIALIIFITGGPLEEFGWRGFLMPELREKYSFLVTILIMGLIHSAWHIPLHYIDSTVQSAMSIWEFFAITILITVSYGFVLEFTKNLWPMILLHWLSNLSSAMFIYWDNSTGRYLLFAFTLILDVFLILFVYRFKNKKEITAS